MLPPPGHPAGGWGHVEWEAAVARNEEAWWIVSPYSEAGGKGGSIPDVSRAAIRQRAVDAPRTLGLPELAERTQAPLQGGTCLVFHNQASTATSDYNCD